MGYHATVQAAIKALIVAAVDVPVLEGAEADEPKTDRMASFVYLLRESIEYEPHVEINPDTSSSSQYEQWQWALYVVGGGGGSRVKDRAATVDTLLETIKTALNAQKLTSNCGPLHLVSEEYEGRHNSGVMYVQRWNHDRL